MQGGEVSVNASLLETKAARSFTMLVTGEGGARVWEGSVLSLRSVFKPKAETVAFPSRLQRVKGARGEGLLLGDPAWRAPPFTALVGGRLRAARGVAGDGETRGASPGAAPSARVSCTSEPSITVLRAPHRPRYEGLRLQSLRALARRLT